MIQITVSVQPGNSGGPVLDSSGNVIGVVVARLDALKLAQRTGRTIGETIEYMFGRAEADISGSGDMGPTLGEKRMTLNGNAPWADKLKAH